MEISLEDTRYTRDPSVHRQRDRREETQRQRPFLLLLSTILIERRRAQKWLRSRVDNEYRYIYTRYFSTSHGRLKRRRKETISIPIELQRRESAKFLSNFFTFHISSFALPWTEFYRVMLLPRIKPLLWDLLTFRLVVIQPRAAEGKGEGYIHGRSTYAISSSKGGSECILCRKRDEIVGRRR